MLKRSKAVVAKRRRELAMQDLLVKLYGKK